MKKEKMDKGNLVGLYGGSFFYYDTSYCNDDFYLL